MSILVIEFFSEYFDAKPKILAYMKTLPYAVSVIFIEKIPGLKDYSSEASQEYRLMAELLKCVYERIEGKTEKDKVFIFNFNLFSSLIPEKPKLITPNLYNVDFMLSKEDNVRLNTNEKFIDVYLVEKRLETALELIMS